MPSISEVVAILVQFASKRCKASEQRDGCSSIMSGCSGSNSEAFLINELIRVICRYLCRNSCDKWTKIHSYLWPSNAPATLQVGGRRDM